MLSQQIIRIAKFSVTVIGAGLTLLSKNNAEKMLDEKISKKIIEELSKRQENEPG